MDVDSDCETRACIRGIWVLEGTLNLNHEHWQLTNLAKEYAKIDSVPLGYDSKEIKEGRVRSVPLK